MSAEDIAAIAERLRELLAKATPGPWHVRPENWEFHAHIRSSSDQHIGGGAAEGNVVLIVEAVNALPALLDALGDAEANNTQMATEANRLLDALAQAEAREGEWARWIAQQTRRTDWACGECVDADLSNNRDLVDPTFRCVWHEARALLEGGQP